MDLQTIWKAFKEEIFGKPVGTLTSGEAWNLVRYDQRILGKVFEKELYRIEQLILYKSRNSNIENTLIITISENKKDLYEEVKKHFIEKGFICFFKEFDELKGELFLIISWKEGGLKNNTESA